MSTPIKDVGPIHHADRRQRPPGTMPNNGLSSPTGTGYEQYVHHYLICKELGRTNENCIGLWLEGRGWREREKEKRRKEGRKEGRKEEMLTGDFTVAGNSNDVLLEHARVRDSDQNPARV